MDVREKLVELFYDNNVRCDQKIEGLADDVMDIVAQSVTVQEWISVKDSLPDKNGNYLTYDQRYGDIEIYYYMGWDEWDHHRNGITDAEGHGFTHWMPLPQPPVDLTRMFENVSIDDLRSYRKKINHRKENKTYGTTI